MNLDQLKLFEGSKTTSTRLDSNNFIISIRYKQNHPKIVVGIMIIDWFISLSLCTLIPRHVVRMKKKLFEEVKKTSEAV